MALTGPFLAPPPTGKRVIFPGRFLHVVHSQHSELHRALNPNPVHWWRKSCLSPNLRCKASAKNLGLDR